MSAADGTYAKLPIGIGIRAARICPTCAALIYDRDDAEQTHRRFHANHPDPMGSTDAMGQP